MQSAKPRLGADIIRSPFASHVHAGMTFAPQRRQLALILATLGLALAGSGAAQGPAPQASPAPAVATIPGMPAVADAANLYSETSADKMSPAIAGDLKRVYVPNLQSNDVYVIDQQTLAVVDKFRVGLNPQHVVPSWDMRTLWVANNAENTKV